MHERKQNNIIDFMGSQVLVSDPRYQGYGLASYQKMDSYANKFYILSGSEGLFVTPTAVPESLVEYYQDLGITVATESNTLVVDGSEDGLVTALLKSKEYQNNIEATQASFLLAYMQTPELQQLATVVGLETLLQPSQKESLADKIAFQQALAEINTEVQSDFGFEVGIPHVVIKAGETQSLELAYKDLSQNGTKDIVIVKPKSAAGKGVFFLRAGSQDQLLPLIEREFDESELVLLESAIEHNHSPSMQGSFLPGESYEHLYLGTQTITTDTENGVGMNDYKSAQVPFGLEEKVNARNLALLKELHLFIAEKIIVPELIHGVIGFDSVLSLNSEGKITDIKFTEINLHLPGSLATFAATEKVFPDGFDGIAYNSRYAYSEGIDFKVFMQKNQNLLIKNKGEYGIFPIIANYPTAVDLIIFAKDLEHRRTIEARLQV